MQDFLPHCLQHWLPVGLAEGLEGQTCFYGSSTGVRFIYSRMDDKNMCQIDSKHRGGTAVHFSHECSLVYWVRGREGKGLTAGRNEGIEKRIGHGGGGGGYLKLSMVLS